MKFKRATIYKRYKADTSVSYMLVLNTHKRGMSFVYLTESCNNKFYTNIDGLYIDDIGGCVSIDRILYLDWSKVIAKHYEKYRELSGREMRKISIAIKDLYDGVISYDKNDHLFYTDIESEDLCIHDDNKEFAVKKEETVAEATTIIENTTTTTKSTIAEVLQDNCISVSISNDKGKCEKYVDLLAKDDTINIGSKKSFTCNSVAHKSESKLHRHIFSESEALAIAAMSCSEIIQKYNVSKSIANKMKQNANKYFGFKSRDRNSSDHSCSITELFRQGLSVEQVIDEHPEFKINVVRSCYYAYCIAKIDKTTNIDDLQKDILDNGSIDDFIEINGMTYKQFCTKYKCSIMTAKTIKVAIRNILSKNIYFAVFGAEAYRDLNTRIKNANKNNVLDRIDVTNFNTCTRLKNIYEATYNDHFDIITGSKPLPESLNGKDRERFINIIKQRCNERVYSRSYTIDQLHMIDKRDIEGLANILVINYRKTLTIMNTKGSSASNR